ncbi:hypothetical protein XI03_19790 [Bradyrhizobium sp. CCBAU 65884]|nr:hypothetical protein [Bradyrhizobium sp. CCBAU 65884]
MQPDPLVILRNRVIFHDTLVPNNARNRLGLRHVLLFHKQFEGTIAPAACRHFEDAGLVAFGINYGPNVEALQERACRDAFGELLEMPAFT